MTSFLKNMPSYNRVGFGKYPTSVYLIRQAFYDSNRLFEFIPVNIRQGILFRQQGEQLVFTAAPLHLGVVHSSNQGNALFICQFKHFDLMEPVGIEEVKPLDFLSQLVFPGIQVRELISDVCQQAGCFGNDRSICRSFQVSGRKGYPRPLAVVSLTELFQVLSIDTGPDNLLRFFPALLSRLLGRLRWDRFINRQSFDFSLLFE